MLRKTNIKNKKKLGKVLSLLLIIFSNVISIFLSAIYDKKIQLMRGNSINFGFSYGLWFFTGGSAGTSLITIIGAIRKIYLEIIISIAKEDIGEQSFDVSVTVANLISGLVFCLGGYTMTNPGNKILLGRIPNSLVFFGKDFSTFKIGLLYNFFGHVLSPILQTYFFFLYCKIEKFKKLKKKAFILNLIHPLLYTIFVFSRPLLFPLKKVIYAAGEHNSHKYPGDYPYFFFYWCAGRLSNIKNNEHFGNNGNCVKKMFFGNLLTITLSFLIFSFFLFSLMFLKEKFDKKRKLKPKFNKRFNNF